MSEPTYNDEGMLLNSLFADDKAKALDIAIEKKVPKGKTLIEQGYENNHIYLIRDGAAKVVLATPSGKDVILDYLGPAQLAGELSLFDRQPSSASVVTIEPTTVAIFERGRVLAFLRENPEFAIRIIQIMATRIRKANEMIEGDRAHTMASKLARGLLRLAKDHGDNGGSSIRIKISQTDLGNFVSLSRENVNRQLKEWTATGMITKEGGQIEIVDYDTLEDLAIFGE